MVDIDMAVAYKNRQEARKRQRYNMYKHRALKKYKVFSLTFEEFNYFISGDCVFCGMKCLDNKFHGIDRFDNTKPYTVTNCNSCCHLCNHMKRDLSYGDFLDHIDKLNKRLIAVFEG